MAYATCTRFRVVCPECGRVGVASWTHETDVVRCRGCGARFAYRQHTYRPATAGMSEEERAEYMRERDREYRKARREHVNEVARESYARHADERRARNRRHYREHRGEALAYSREYYLAHREEIRRQKHEWYIAHKEEIKARRKRRSLDEYRARRRELGEQTSELGKQDLDRQEES